jgi:hypothetical protein
MQRLILLLALAACGVPAKELPPAGYWAVGDTRFTESTCGPAPEQTAVMHAFVEHGDGAFVLSWGNPWRMTDVECPYTWDWRFVCPAGDGVPYGDDRARGPRPRSWRAGGRKRRTNATSMRRRPSRPGVLGTTVCRTSAGGPRR